MVRPPSKAVLVKAAAPTAVLVDEVDEVDAAQSK
jgi:hypothetical protein